MAPVRKYKLTSLCKVPAYPNLATWLMFSIIITMVGHLHANWLFKTCGYMLYLLMDQSLLIGNKSEQGVRSALFRSTFILIIRLVTLMFSNTSLTIGITTTNWLKLCMDRQFPTQSRFRSLAAQRNSFSN